MPPYAHPGRAFRFAGEGLAPPAQDAPVFVVYFGECIPLSPFPFDTEAVRLYNEK